MRPACPLRVLIGPQVLVLLGSSTERRCAERRDLSGGRDGWDGRLKAGIFLRKFWDYGWHCALFLFFLAEKEKNGFKKCVSFWGTEDGQDKFKL